MKKMRIFVGLALLLGFLVPPTPAAASPSGATLYVTPTGAASGDCTETAPCSLRYAVEMRACPGDIILVESGTYSDSTSGLDQLLYIDKGLRVFGSCDFTGSAPFICDSRNHSSILDAGGNKRVVTIEGTGSESVYFWGFVLQNGNADGVPTGACNASLFAPLEGCGGGMNVSDIAYIHLRNNIFRNNVAGSAPVNMSYLSLGGGLYAEDVNGMFAEGNQFRFNYAAYNGLGLGGGAFVLNSGTASTEILFERNIFSYNEVSMTHDGWGGGLMSTQDTNLILDRNVFTYNNVIQDRLADGAAVHIDSSSFEMTNNFISQNEGFSTVHIEGGHFWGEAVWNQLQKNSVVSNVDIIGHGTLYLYHNFISMQPVTQRGGASSNVNISGDGAFMLAVMIRHNTISYGGFGINLNDNVDVYIDRNIIAYHDYDAIDNSGTTGTSWLADSNLFWGNASTDITGTNPISGSPNFVDGPNGDLHLTVSSAAIDQAIDANPRYTFDIDGETIPVAIFSANTPFDIGADEFTHQIYLPMVLNP